MTIPSTSFIELERKLTSVSLAIQLLDVYTGGEALGRVSVSIAGNKAPLKNPSGYYVFTDLPPATYDITVETELYLPETVAVPTGAPHDRVKKISLIPNGAYPFSSAATLVRGVVSGSGGGPLAEAALQAVSMLPETSAKAKIGPAGATAGDTLLPLVNISGQLAVGDRLMIRDSNTARIEFCTINGPLPANPATDPYATTVPLKYTHSAGTTLHLLGVDSVLNSRTTPRGEFVVYFSPTKSPRFISTLSISHAHYQTYQQDLEVSEGSEQSLGRIQLIP